MPIELRIPSFIYIRCYPRTDNQAI